MTNVAVRRDRYAFEEYRMSIYRSRRYLELAKSTARRLPLSWRLPWSRHPGPVRMPPRRCHVSLNAVLPDSEISLGHAPCMHWKNREDSTRNSREKCHCWRSLQPWRGGWLPAVTSVLVLTKLTNSRFYQRAFSHDVVLVFIFLKEASVGAGNWLTIHIGRRVVKGFQHRFFCDQIAKVFELGVDVFAATIQDQAKRRLIFEGCRVPVSGTVRSSCSIGSST